MGIEYRTSIHRYSNVSGLQPNASELYPGEIALNLADGKLFMLNITGDVVDLTRLNSYFTIQTAQDGWLLVFDAVSQTYKSTASLDGGTF